MCSTQDPLPQDAVQLVCNELGYTGTSAATSLRSQYDFVRQYSRSSGTTNGVSAPDDPIMCPADGAINTLGDCDIGNNQDCGNRQPFAVQCAAPSIELREGPKGVLEGRIAVEANDLVSGVRTVGRWGTVCFGRQMEDDMPIINSYCASMGSSTPVFDFQEGVPSEEEFVALKAFTTRQPNCNELPCTGDGFFETAWASAEARECSVV